MPISVWITRCVNSHLIKSTMPKITVFVQHMLFNTAVKPLERTRVSFERAVRIQHTANIADCFPWPFDNGMFHLHMRNVTIYSILRFQVGITVHNHPAYRITYYTES